MAKDTDSSRLSKACLSECDTSPDQAFNLTILGNGGREEDWLDELVIHPTPQNSVPTYYPAYLAYLASKKSMDFARSDQHGTSEGTDDVASEASVRC